MTYGVYRAAGAAEFGAVRMLGEGSDIADELRAATAKAAGVSAESVSSTLKFLASDSASALFGRLVQIGRNRREAER